MHLHSSYNFVLEKISIANQKFLFKFIVCVSWCKRENQFSYNFQHSKHVICVFFFYACVVSFTLGIKRRSTYNTTMLLLLFSFALSPRSPWPSLPHWHGIGKRRQVYVQRGWKMALAMILESLLTTSSIYTYTKISQL